jgi:hypothetical protein
MPDGRDARRRARFVAALLAGLLALALTGPARAGATAATHHRPAAPHAALAAAGDTAQALHRHVDSAVTTAAVPGTALLAGQATSNSSSTVSRSTAVPAPARGPPGEPA